VKQILVTATLVLAGHFAAIPAASADLGVSVIFSDKEISIIGTWYQDHSQSHGKKKTKSKGLPPGIAKNLGRGKPLPPGIAKQYLPTDLNLMLPPPRKGFERVIVDGKVLLVEIATRVVHDILTDIILH
jgi:Ni/Co efflux regulator RcnB